MNITEETQKLATNPLLRYGVLMIGLLIIILSQGVLTWKRTSPRDAMGEVAQIQLDIKYYQKDLDEAEKAAEKKEIRESIKKLREEKLVDARMDAEEEQVDAQNGIWFWSMVHHTGLALLSIGFVIVASMGGNYEKVGALVALGFIVSQL